MDRPRRCIQAARQLGGIWIALLLLGCQAESAAVRESEASSGLPVNVRIEHPLSTVDEPLELRVTVRNPTDQTQQFLLWQTPFERELSADLFRVEHDGKVLPYRGRLLKRTARIRNEDLLSLDAGESLDRVIDLARYYALDSPGEYRVRFTPSRVSVSPAIEPRATLRAADETAHVFERMAR